MKNRKAFTIVELIATITILSVLLMVAVPSISKIMENNKKRTFVEDAKRFLNVVKNEMESNTEIDYPASDKYLVFKLKDFNEKDFKISPYGTIYDEDSFVALKGNNKYYIYLIACDDSACKGTDEIKKEGKIEVDAITDTTKKAMSSVLGTYSFYCYGGSCD